MRADYTGALPPGFSVVEALDDDASATTYLISDGSGYERVLTIAKATLSDERKAEFAKWVSTVTKLADGPHVVSLRAADVTDDGRPYLIIDHRTTLADRLARDGVLSPSAVIRFGVGLTDALMAGAAVGMAHGAVQPDSVLVIDEQAVLAGFDTTAPGLELPLAPSLYMSPEQLAGAMSGTYLATETGDVYGLSVTLYVAAGGAPPWIRAPSDLIHRATQLPGVANIPPDLLGLLRSGTAIEPAQRPTLAQLRDSLDSLQLPDESDQTHDAVSEELLTGQGVRRISKRTTAVVATTAGMLGAGGSLLTGAISADVAVVPPAAAVASAPSVTAGAPLAPVPEASTTAATSSTAATVTGSITVTKVVVVAAAVAVVGAGAGIVVPRLVSDTHPCDAIVGDKPATQVLVDASRNLQLTSYKFTSKTNQYTDIGAVDPVADRAWFTRSTSVEQKTIEFRRFGSTVLEFEPPAGDRPGQWRPTTNGDDPSRFSGLNGIVSSVRTNGCDFEGTIDPKTLQLTTNGQIDFKARIDEAGNLTLVQFTSTEGSKTERTFDTYRVTVDVSVPGTSSTIATSSTVTPRPTTTPPTKPRRTTLAGRWQKIDGTFRGVLLAIAIAPRQPGGQVTWNDGAIARTCRGTGATSGTTMKVNMECFPVAHGVSHTVTATIQLVDDNTVKVQGYPDINGTYRFTGK